MRRLISWLIIFGVVAGGVYYVWIRVRSWMEQRNKMNYVETVVTKGRIATVVNSTETIKPVQSAWVGAFISGPVSKVNVDFNSSVKKGDVLGEIDPKLLQAAVDRDCAAVESHVPISVG